MNTSFAAGTLVNVSVTDWAASKTVELDGVPLSETVGGVLREAIDALKLPVKEAYQALFEGRQLNKGTTLREAGIGEDVEFQVVPEVSAGRRA